MSLLLLIAGLFLLVIAGDALVRGAVAAAQRLHIPPLIIGLTVVALGTSAPELVVSLEAALKGAPGLAIGNVVGSNISNMLLVLGLPAIFAPIALTGSGIRRALIFMIAASLALWGMMLDANLARLDALVLLLALCAYLGYSAFEAKRARTGALSSEQLSEINDIPLSVTRISLLIAFGIIGLALGGRMTTDGAMGVAAALGIADTAVGLTIVALGTSLPELAAGVSAAMRREGGVAIGNVLGSNVFNMLGILGITAAISPLSVPQSILDFDIWVMIGSALIFIPIAFYIRHINRLTGFVMTIAYLAYVVYVFVGTGS